MHSLILYASEYYTRVNIIHLCAFDALYCSACVAEQDKAGGSCWLGIGYNGISLYDLADKLTVKRVGGYSHKNVPLLP